MDVFLTMSDRGGGGAYKNLGKFIVIVDVFLTTSEFMDVFLTMSELWMFHLTMSK